MFEVTGRRVTVMGLGRFGGGVGVSRWLCAQGAKVTISDKAPAEELAESIRALGDADVRLHLGSHEPADFADADLIIVNPAVPKDSPALVAARDAGVPMTTEINLFIERCPATMVGITGSVGKSTTTAMIGEMLARRYTTHVGGNIGRSLLEALPDIKPQHVVVLELSSFQLEDLPIIGISPQVALVTNLKPNHLDRHGTMEAYGAAKKNIFRFQKPTDVLVLNRDDGVVAAWAAEAPGRCEFFDGRGEPFELMLPGRHNQLNAQAAWAACRQLGLERAAAAEALRGFAGLPHRLQFVAERAGVRYFNDSKCTTPQGAVVALEAFEPRRAVMIVGGYDKHVGFESLGEALAQRAKAVVALGQTRGQIIAAVEASRQGAQPTVIAADDFDSAVAAACAQAAPGDAVLLSPACASWDMFQNYEQRGRRFIQLVAGNV